MLIKSLNTSSEFFIHVSCPPDKIIYDEERGEYICTETGEVLEERVVDEHADWRAFTPEEKMERDRVGSPVNQSVHDLGITTEIGLGKRLDGKKRLEALKLMKLHNKTRFESGNRTIIKGLLEIERLCSLLNLPKPVRDEASILFKKAYQKGLVKGRSVDIIAAASIYVACRKMNVVRTTKEIAQYTDLDKIKIERHYRLLVWTLKLNIQPASIKDYIVKFGNQLKLSEKTINNALQLEEKIKGKISGKDPKAVACALLYISGLLNDERRTQKEVARVADISELSIRSRYKEIVNMLKIKFDN